MMIRSIKYKCQQNINYKKNNESLNEILIKMLTNYEIFGGSCNK